MSGMHVMLTYINNRIIRVIVHIITEELQHNNLIGYTRYCSVTTSSPVVIHYMKVHPIYV